MSLFFI
jgi:coronin-1B/1C/6